MLKLVYRDMEFVAVLRSLQSMFKVFCNKIKLQRLNTHTPKVENGSFRMYLGLID